MSKKFVNPVLIVVVIFQVLFSGVLGIVNAQDASMSCTWNFDATVRQGPSVGTALKGELTLGIGTDGALNGSLVTKDMGTIAVVGQANGHAVNLGFELQKGDEKTEGLYVFGTGTAWTHVTPDTHCGGIMGGTFAGPKLGDIGDWFTCVGYRTEGGGCIGVSY